MRRRRFLGFAAVVIAWPLSVYGQAKVWRIGMLETISPSQNAGNLKALRDGLRELGYVENENLLIEYRSANGQIDRLPILADELVRLPADLIITRGTPAVLAAKQATSTIPIVMAAIAEPLIAVASLAHPGANVTGFTALLTELQPKRIGITKELLPGMQRIGILLDRRNPIAPAALKDMAAAAQSLGSEVDFFDVRAADDLDRAFAVATERHDAAIIVSVEAVLQANVHLIGTLAVKHGLPTMCGTREFVDAGCLISYGVSYPDLYRRAAGYADKILKGAKPAALPVQQPTKFELVVNLKTARALGLTIPPSILARADEVIE